MSQPIVYDLCCGLGGWTEGFLAEGYRCIGYDIEVHEYGEHKYPGELRLNSILDLDGSELADASCIVASPPCQEFSYMAMPWSRAKVIARALRGDCPFPAGYDGSRTLAQLTGLFDACFRIQREASATGGRHIPLVVENVKGAQPWVGQAKANYGSFYLWGDIETVNGNIVCGGVQFGCGILRLPSKCRKVEGFNFHQFEQTGQPGGSFQSAAVAGVKAPGQDWSRFKQTGEVSSDWKFQGSGGIDALVAGNKGTGGSWFTPNTDDRERPGHWKEAGCVTRIYTSKDVRRKAASALIAKIPLELSSHIARCFKPAREAVA